MAVATLLPVPYVALLPGPTYNTLGPLNGKPIVSIIGHRTFSTGRPSQYGYGFLHRRPRRKAAVQHLGRDPGLAKPA